VNIARPAAGALAVVAALMIAMAQPGFGQEAAGSRPVVLPLIGQSDGAYLDRVVVRIRQSGGSSTRVSAALARLAGSTFDRVAFEARLAQLRSRIGSGAIEYELQGGPGGIALVVEIDTAEDARRDEIAA